MKEIINRIIQMNFTLDMLEYLLRILIAGVCGALIGLERRKRFKDAGLRTHLILSLGCALAMVVSKYAFTYEGLSADAGRIASNIMAGIGFLGAGVIFVRGNSVHGLTTAAGIWTTAAIGMAIGSGFYLLGILLTVVLILVQMVVYRLFPSFEAIDNMEIYMKVVRKKELVEQIKKRLEDTHFFITSIEVKKNTDSIELKINAKTLKNDVTNLLLASFTDDDDILEISTNHYN